MYRLAWLFIGLCIICLVTEAATGALQNWPAETGLTVSIVLVLLAMTKLRSETSISGTVVLAIGVIPAAVVQVWTVVIPVLAVVLVGLAVVSIRDQRGATH
jgi:hypothetical protein